MPTDHDNGYKRLFPPGVAGLAAYRPQARYLLIDESAYADAGLASQRNLVAALFRLENSREPETVREVLAALTAWLAEPEQAELRRSFLLWLREGFLKARLPNVSFPELNNLEEARIMPAERVVDWNPAMETIRPGTRPGTRPVFGTAVLQRLIRRRFGEAMAAQSMPALEQIKEPATFEDLSEELLDCVDESAWLTRL